MNTTKLTINDRNTLNKFCLSRATSIKFSTNCLRQQLKMEMLKNAFAELEEKANKRIKQLQQNVQDFENLTFSQQQLSYFGGQPTKTQYIDYVDSMILQEQGAVEIIRNNYIIAVNTEFPSEESKALHNSFNPRVTFGYGGMLHEECIVNLTQELVKLLATTTLCHKAPFDALNRSYGSFFLDQTFCYYEDTAMYVGDRVIMETVSHEQMYDIYFTDEDIELFKTFEGKQIRNEKIISKLQSKKLCF